MSYEYSVYDANTGRVMFTLIHPSENYPAIHTGSGQGVIDGHLDPDTEYVVDEDVAARPEMQLSYTATIVADMIDEAVIGGIPEGAMVFWPDGFVSIETDGQVELSTDTPGQYRFLIQKFPYRDKEIIIEAVAN